MKILNTRDKAILKSGKVRKAEEIMQYPELVKYPNEVNFEAHSKYYRTT